MITIKEKENNISVREGFLDTSYQSDLQVLETNLHEIDLLK